MWEVMQACVIMHNMIIEDDRKNHARTHVGPYECQGPLAEVDHELPADFADFLAMHAEIRDSNVHDQLQADLVKHLSSRLVQDLGGRVSSELLPDFVRLWLAAERVHLTPGEPDAFTWLLSDSGSYSAASAYRLQFLGSTDCPLVASIWDAWAPAKYRLFAWLIVQNRVLMADRLMARQWPNSYFCPLCWRNLETAEHLLVECPWSRNLWTLVASRFGLASLRPEIWRSPGPLTA
ncbi:hypothetical protein QYE76_014774 [Lolium multiflorum]|uniref:Reverse transcriptase zinc-binding domain-containing protein n=1 Tax=Lolium multiflorum TaxID=4521 RepID=A0AAD8U3L5_LOLMU|nr:hypothetical protein QYE76_014774 [Lolium multiflorum]